jgi:chemotaxis signal transduction protein
VSGGRHSIDAILDVRARTLAARRSGKTAAEETPALRAAILRETGGLYAIALSALRHVMPFQRYSAVSGRLASLIGITSYGSDVYNIIDLGVLIGARSTPEWKAEGHLLLLRDAYPRIALRSERVESIADVVPVETPSEKTTPFTGAYARVRGDNGALATALVAMIDIQQLISSLTSPSQETAS